MTIAAPPAAVATRAAAPLRAPAPASGLASLVPVARAGEGVRLVLRHRAQLPAPTSPTAIILGRHAGPDAEALPHPLVEGVRGGTPDEPLVCAEGCEVRVGPRLVGGAARRALLTWLPPARRELVVLEAGLLAGDAAAAVTLLLRPPTIWSRAEADAVRRHLRAGPLDPGRFLALERQARAHVGRRPLGRLRAALLRLEAQAPFPGLPRATATVLAGCATLREDEARAVEAAATQLARYACCRSEPPTHATARAC